MSDQLHYISRQQYVPHLPNCKVMEVETWKNSVKKKKKKVKLPEEAVCKYPPIKRFFSLMYSGSESNISPAKARHGLVPAAHFSV